MFDIIMMDSFGNQITFLTQWDNDQFLQFDGVILRDDNAPIVHFCNKYSKQAIGVQSTLNKNIIKVEVPNILLQESETIIAYFYSNGRTIEITQIPVRPKPQPTDYIFSENIHIVYLSELINEVKMLDKTIDSNESIRQQAETLRISAESERKLAESKRVSSENVRIENEKNRQLSTQTAIDNCKEVTDNCNQVAENLEESYREVKKSETNVVQLAYSVSESEKNIINMKDSIFKSENNCNQVAENLEESYREVIDAKAYVLKLYNDLVFHVSGGNAESLDIQNIDGGNSETIDRYKYDTGNATSIDNTNI